MRRRGTQLALGLLVTWLSMASAGDPPRMNLDGWGTITDPDGDCKFTIERGRLAIAMPGTVHALSAELGRMNAPRVLRNVEGDFSAEVRVLGDMPEGVASLVPGRRPFRGAGLIVWRDAASYIRLERAEMMIGGRKVRFVNFELRDDGRWLRVGDSTEHPLATDGPIQLRLGRQGGQVRASVSEDGVHWTELKPIVTSLPERLSVGVAATHNTAAPFEARFEGFRLFVDATDPR